MIQKDVIFPTKVLALLEKEVSSDTLEQIKEIL